MYSSRLHSALILINLSLSVLTIQFKEVIAHNDADTLQLLRVYAVLVKQVIHISTVTAQLARQPYHALAVRLQPLPQNISNVHNLLIDNSLYKNIYKEARMLP